MSAGQTTDSETKGLPRFLQRAAEAPAAGGQSAEASDAALRATEGSGEPLPTGVRRLFGAALGRDFERVRVHTDAAAASAAEVEEARAFTIGSDIVFGEGRFRPETPEGLVLLGHELTHVTQQTRRGTRTLQRAPDPPGGKTDAKFDVDKWYTLFQDATIRALSRFYLELRDVPINKVEKFEGEVDAIHPAHYDPNKRKILWSITGWRTAYRVLVVEKKIWTVAQFRQQQIETALHEAFHAYQDTPRHRSKSFKAFEKKIGPVLRKEMMGWLESGVVDSYEEFKETGHPVLTSRYLPEEKIELFMGENLPEMRRDPRWHLSRREEILNQWLHITSDWYFRTRGIEAFLREGRRKARIRTGPPLVEEPKHEVSLVELQASAVGRLRAADVDIWLKSRELAREKDPKKKAKLRKEIDALKAGSEVKKIRDLEARRKALTDESAKLGDSPEDEKKRRELNKELGELDGKVAALEKIANLEKALRGDDPEKSLLISKAK